MAEMVPVSRFDFYIVSRGRPPSGRSFQPFSTYADVVWLAAIGPVALMTYRMLVAVAGCDSTWVPIDRDDLLSALGMSGERTQLDLAVSRLVAHDLLVQRRFELTVRMLMPAVHDVMLRRLPAMVQRYHHETLADADPSEPNAAEG